MNFRQKSRWSKILLLFFSLSILDKGWVRQTHSFELGALVITQEALYALTLGCSMLWRACTNSNNSTVDRVLHEEISRLTYRNHTHDASQKVFASVPQQVATQIAAVEHIKPVPIVHISPDVIQKIDTTDKAHTIASHITHEYAVQATYATLSEETKAASREFFHEVAIDWHKQIEQCCHEWMKTVQVNEYNRVQMYIQEWNRGWPSAVTEKGLIYYAPNPAWTASINVVDRRRHVCDAPVETPEHFERMVINMNPEYYIPVQNVIQAFVKNAELLVYGTVAERIAALLNISEFSITGITYGQELCDAKIALYAAYCHTDGSICLNALQDMRASQQIMQEYYGFKREHTKLFRKPCVTPVNTKSCKLLIKTNRKVPSFSTIRNESTNQCCKKMLLAFASGDMQQVKQIRNENPKLQDLAFLYNALKAEYEKAIQQQEALLKDEYGIIHCNLPAELRDPLYAALSNHDRERLKNNPSALVSLNDTLKLRQLYKNMLHKAWTIPATADSVVHQALYALVDIGTIPERIDRIHELVSDQKLTLKEQQALTQAFFLSNGIIKDFAEYDSAQSLQMPAAILQSDHTQNRLLLNHLVYAKRVCEDAQIHGTYAEAIECIHKAIKEDDQERSSLYFERAKILYDRINNPMDDEVRGTCGTGKQKDTPLPTGECLPDTDNIQKGTPCCLGDQLDLIEKDRVCGSDNDPDRISLPPPCGFAGQTLPGFGSDEVPADKGESEDTEKDKSKEEEEEDKKSDSEHGGKEIGQIDEIPVESGGSSTFIPAQAEQMFDTNSLQDEGTVSNDTKEMEKKSKNNIKIPTQQEIDETKAIELRLLEGTTKRSPSKQTSGRTTQYDTPTYETLQEAIDAAKEKFKLAHPEDIVPIPTGERGDLPDGRRINWRNTSTDKVPTVEIHNLKNDRKIKIRFKNKENI